MSRFRSTTAIAAGLALIGCASAPPPRGLQVEPVQSVRHGMDAGTLYRTGRYFQGQVRFEEAMQAYRRALAAEPNHVDSLNALGVIHSLRNEPGQAEQAFRLALEADPQAARVHNNLGYHLMQNGRVAEAIMAFEKARELEPGNADTGVNLAAARAKLGLAVEPAVATAPPVAAPPVAAPAAATPALAAAAVPVVQLEAVATVAVPVPIGRVEIANGNGATGLARRVSTAIVAADGPRPRLTNDKPYGVRTSRIQYVDGAERLAQDINARLPLPLPMARASALERDVRVRVLLGRDFPPRQLTADLSTRRNS